MKELFYQIVMRLALCGLAASFAVLVFRSWPVRAAFARLAAIWRGLTAFGRFAVCAFLFVGVLEADKTNNVNNLPPLANDWADSSYEIGDWIVLSSEGYPEPGYVAADPDPDTSGHMGILDFDGSGISAGTSNVNRHFDTGSSNIVRRKLEE